MLVKQPRVVLVCLQLPGGMGEDAGSMCVVCGQVNVTKGVILIVSLNKKIVAAPVLYMTGQAM